MNLPGKLPSLPLTYPPSSPAPKSPQHLQTTESLDREAEIDVVDLSAASDAAQRLLRSLTRIQALPPNHSDEDLSLPLHLSKGVAGRGAGAARLALVLLDGGAEVVLGGRGAADGEALDELGVDDLLGCVGLELDEVDGGLAGHDRLELAHDFLEGWGSLEFGLGGGVLPA